MRRSPMSDQRITPRRSARRRIAGVVVALAAVAGCTGDSTDESDDDQQQTEDSVVDDATALADMLEENGLTSVASALESIDLGELVGTDDFTFLAPNDEAFQAVSADELATLLADPDAVSELLQNHTLPERLSAAELADAASVDTAAGRTLDVSDVDGAIVLGEATVVTSDLEVSDGVVHVVDRLLLP